MTKVSRWTRQLSLQYSRDQAFDYLFAGQVQEIDILRSNLQLTTICHHIRTLYVKLYDSNVLSDSAINSVLYLISESKASVSYLTALKDYTKFDTSNNWWREHVSPFEHRSQYDFYGIKAGTTFRKTKGFDQQQYLFASKLFQAQPARFYAELFYLCSLTPDNSEILYLSHVIAWLRYRIEVKIINTESRFSYFHRQRQKLSLLLLRLYRSLKRFSYPFIPSRLIK